MSDTPRHKTTAPALNWRRDEFGRPERALYLGGLYVGCVLHWPDNPRSSSTPWRAWVVDVDEDGEVGWYETEADAKTALAARVEGLLANG